MGIGILQRFVPSPIGLAGRPPSEGLRPRTGSSFWETGAWVNRTGEAAA